LKNFDRKKIITAILLIVSVLACGVIYLTMRNSDESSAFDSTADTIVNAVEGTLEPTEMPPLISPEPEKIMVQVMGAVINPGVIELEDGMRVIDAVEAAGGFAEDADRESVNLAAYAYDTQQIRIYRIEETSHSGEIESGSDGYNKTSPHVEGVIGGKIDINTASKELIMTLPGIGEAKAAAIVEYRNANGGFKRTEDLKNVSGIGDKIYDGLKDSVTVE